METLQINVLIQYKVCWKTVISAFSFKECYVLLILKKELKQLFRTSIIKIFFLQGIFCHWLCLELSVHGKNFKLTSGQFYYCFNISYTKCPFPWPVPRADSPDWQCPSQMANELKNLNPIVNYLEGSTRNIGRTWAVFPGECSEYMCRYNPLVCTQGVK
jgi:hypothetical protein